MAYCIPSRNLGLFPRPVRVISISHIGRSSLTLASLDRPRRLASILVLPMYLL